MNHWTRSLQFLGLFVLGLFAAEQSQAQDNLVSNGYFESWTNGQPDHWQFEKFTGQGTGEVLRGSFSLKQMVRVNRMWQVVDEIEGGSHYTISFHYFDNDPGAYGRVYAWWLDGDDMLEEDGELLRPEPFSGVDDEWRKFSVSLAAPPEADGLHLEVRTIGSEGESGHIYYDDFSVVQYEPITDGGHETFANMERTGNIHADGTFLGQDGSEWTFVQCRGLDSFDGRAIMLGRSRDPQPYVESGVIPDGIGVISFEYMQAFSTDVNLQLMVNGQVVATVTSDDQLDEVLESGEIEVHAPGEVVIRFMNRYNSSGQVVIDNVVWTDYDESLAPVVVGVASLADLREAEPDGETIFVMDGEAVVSWRLAPENKYFLQDETAGVVLWDKNGIIEEDYMMGDGISGLRGRLIKWNHTLCWVPVECPGEASSHGADPEPLPLSLQELAGSGTVYQSRLIELQDVYFSNKGGVFAEGECYVLSDGEAEIDFCVFFPGADYIGTPIPEGDLKITGLVTSGENGPVFTARSLEDIRISDSPRAFAVVFTVVDDSETLKQVQMAGDMTNWDFVSMLEDPAHNWSVTLNIPPGSYAWNAAGNDGYGSSFWMMPDSHLNVTVDQDGNTTGDNSYVYMVVGESAIDLSVVKVYPNPAGTHLFVESAAPIQQIRVMNTSNQVIYTNNQVNSDVYEMNVGRFAPGMYMIQVETVSGMAMEKVQVGGP